MISAENYPLPAFTTIGLAVKRACSLPRQGVEKVTSVAIAFFLCACVQFSLSASVAAGIALSAAAITVISYNAFPDRHTETSAWFSTTSLPKNFSNFKAYATRIALVNLIRGVVVRILQMPAQMPTLHWISLTCLFEPIIQEIIYRGFVQERLEEGLILANLQLVSIDESIQKRIALVGQAIICGAMQLDFSIPMRFFTSILGYKYGQIKNDNDNSLLPSMASHGIYNIFIVVRKILFGA